MADPKDVARVVAELDATCGKLLHSDMDNANFIRSREQYDEGEVITVGHSKWRVLYSWLWLTVEGDHDFYTSELEPIE